MAEMLKNFKKRLTHFVEYDIIMQNNELEEKGMTNYEKVTALLRDLGIPPHIKGYHYLREAILLAAENPLIINSITRELYPVVAAQFETMPTRVERAMRHAIEAAWYKGNKKLVKLFEGVTNSKPANSLFIALLAEDIRMEAGSDGN